MTIYYLLNMSDFEDFLLNYKFLNLKSKIVNLKFFNDSL